MLILGIETTCDETGIGIVKDGQKVLSNIVASSALMHKKYGGVVPEVAAREQVKMIVPCLSQALTEGKCKLSDIDAFAVAYGPGLAGSLIVGVETAKALAAVFGKPLIAVNHLVGHVYANFVRSISNLPEFPMVALIVSGGHTDLILMKSHYDYIWLGGTRDDAAGEAFDKVARVLGLGYPGGPEIERVARNFQFPISNFQFPRPLIGEDNFDFSFSGLKTAVVNLVNSSQFAVHSIEEIANEFQNAVVDVLTWKTISAARKYNAKSIVVGGGVAANSELRRQILASLRGSTLSNLAKGGRSGSDVGNKINIDVFFPQKKLSVDNGVMIAAAAFYQKNIVNPLKLQSDSGLYFA